MKKKGRLSTGVTLGLIITIFSMPIIAATLLYLSRDTWHFSTKNLGHLIQPPIHLSILSPRPYTDLKTPVIKPHLWLVAYMTDTPCDKSCRFNLDKMLSVYYALGEKSHAVQPLFIGPDSDISIKTMAKEPHWHKLTFTKGDTTAARETMNQYSFSEVGNAAFFIADPKGNIMLHYAANVAGNDILKDLRHLLKVAKR